VPTIEHVAWEWHIIRQKDWAKTEPLVSEQQDRSDAEIHLWRKAGIQAHFLPAEVAAQRRGRVVKKAEVFGLLQLIDPVGSKHYC